MPLNSNRVGPYGYHFDLIEDLTLLITSINQISLQPLEKSTLVVEKYVQNPGRNASCP